MKTIALNLSRKNFEKKPSKNSTELCKLFKQSSYSLNLIDTENLYKHLTNGKCIVPFRNNNTNEVYGNNLIVVDIDNINQNELDEKLFPELEKQNIYPTIIYPSYSDSPQSRRLHFVYVLDRIVCPIISGTIYRSLHKYLKELNLNAYVDYTDFSKNLVFGSYGKKSNFLNPHPQIYSPSDLIREDCKKIINFSGGEEILKGKVKCLEIKIRGNSRDKFLTYQVYLESKNELGLNSLESHINQLCNQDIYLSSKEYDKVLKVEKVNCKTSQWYINIAPLASDLAGTYIFKKSNESLPIKKSQNLLNSKSTEFLPSRSFNQRTLSSSTQFINKFGTGDADCLVWRKLALLEDNGFHIDRKTFFAIFCNLALTYKSSRWQTGINKILYNAYSLLNSDSITKDDLKGIAVHKDMKDIISKIKKGEIESQFKKCNCPNCSGQRILFEHIIFEGSLNAKKDEKSIMAKTSKNKKRKISLAQGRKKLKSILSKYKGGKLFIKGVCGLGKSHILAEIAKDEKYKNAIFSTNNHRLCRQLSEWFEKNNVDHILIPESPYKYLPEQWKKELKLIFDSGLEKSTITIYQEAINDMVEICDTYEDDEIELESVYGHTREYLEEAIHKLEEYLHLVTEANTDPFRPVICTNKRVVDESINMDNRVVISDECMDNYVSKESFINSKQVSELLKNRAIGLDIDQIIRRVGTGTLTEGKSLRDDQVDEIIRLTSKGYKNIGLLFMRNVQIEKIKNKYGSYAIKMLYIKNKYPENIIVLSATESLYLPYTNPEFKIEHIDNVKQYSKIIWVEDKNVSKSKLGLYGQNPDVQKAKKTIDKYIDYYEPERVITYKSLGYENVYFGNLHGHNDMQGQDILIIGSHLKKEEDYSIMMKLLKIPHIRKNKVLRINRSGYEFNYWCYYENDEAVDFVLSSLEIELEQAIGRSRPYDPENKNVTIVVVGPVPPPGHFDFEHVSSIE